MERPKKPRGTGSLHTKPLVKEPLDTESLESLSREPLSKSDNPLWRELRILVAAKLYGAERLSSERAAKLAGINHVEFLLSLGFYKVFPLQSELNELEQHSEPGNL